MLVALVVNPLATGFSARKRDQVAAILSARHKLDLVATSQPGEATGLTRRAVADGAELVAVMGGDGTVNEVVNGLDGPDVPIALLAGGKTNVLARAMGMPHDPVRSGALVVELLDSGAQRRISLGRADGRRFTFSAGLGLDGAIVREVERRRRARQLYGDHAWVAAGLRTLFVAYDRATPHLSVHFLDGRPGVGGFFALVGNGDPYTYLGPRPFRPTPQATFEGGLDLLVGQTMATAPLLRAVAGMLSSRPRSGYPELPVHHDETRFRLQADVPLAFQLDGEYLGDRTSVLVESLPGVLTVVAPGGGRRPAYPPRSSRRSRPG